MDSAFDVNFFLHKYGLSENPDLKQEVTLCQSQLECSAVEEDGLFLEEKLLEGALKNINNFPQLLIEVKKVQEEQEQKKRAEDMKKQADEAEREKMKIIAEAEREKMQRMMKKKGISTARETILNAEIEELSAKLDLLNHGNKQQLLRNRKLQSMIDFQRNQLDILAICKDKSNEFLEKFYDSSRELCKSQFGVPINELKFMQVEATIKSVKADIYRQEKQLKELVGEVKRLTKTKLEIENSHQIDTKEMSDYCGRTQQQILTSIDGLLAQKAKLDSMIHQFDTTQHEDCN